MPKPSSSGVSGPYSGYRSIFDRAPCNFASSVSAVVTAPLNIASEPYFFAIESCSSLYATPSGVIIPPDNSSPGSTPPAYGSYAESFILPSAFRALLSASARASWSAARSLSASRAGLGGVSGLGDISIAPASSRTPVPSGVITGVTKVLRKESHSRAPVPTSSAHLSSTGSPKASPLTISRKALPPKISSSVTPSSRVSVNSTSGSHSPSEFLKAPRDSTAISSSSSGGYPAAVPSATAASTML